MEWVYRTSDQVFLRDKGNEPLLDGEAVVTLDKPPGVGERYDPTSPTSRRAATSLELATSADTSLDVQVKEKLDVERLISAVLWCVIDVLAPPVTPAKYQNARGKVIQAFKSQPWKT